MAEGRRGGNCWGDKKRRSRSLYGIKVGWRPTLLARAHQQTEKSGESVLRVRIVGDFFESSRVSIPHLGGWLVWNLLAPDRYSATLSFRAAACRREIVGRYAAGHGASQGCQQRCALLVRTHRRIHQERKGRLRSPASCVFHGSNVRFPAWRVFRAFPACCPTCTRLLYKYYVEEDCCAAVLVLQELRIFPCAQVV